jgi:hypothetical protein
VSYGRHAPYGPSVSGPCRPSRPSPLTTACRRGMVGQAEQAHIGGDTSPVVHRAAVFLLGPCGSMPAGTPRPQPNHRRADQASDQARALQRAPGARSSADEGPTLPGRRSRFLEPPRRHSASERVRGGWPGLNLVPHQAVAVAPGRPPRATAAAEVGPAAGPGMVGGQGGVAMVGSWAEWMGWLVGRSLYIRTARPTNHSQPHPRSEAACGPWSDGRNGPSENRP